MWDRDRDGNSKTNYVVAVCCTSLLDLPECLPLTLTYLAGEGASAWACQLRDPHATVFVCVKLTVCKS